MSFDNLLTFSAQIWLLLGVVACLILARSARPRIAWIVALLALVGALIAMLTQLRSHLDIFNGRFVVDSYSLFFEITLVMNSTARALLVGDGVNGGTRPTAKLRPGTCSPPTSSPKTLWKRNVAEIASARAMSPRKSDAPTIPEI